MAIRRGNNLYWKTGLDNTGLKKGAVQAKGILKTMSQQITGMDLFAGLGIAATIAFAKVTKSAWDMAKGLDLAMREVQTISGAAQENFEAMNESVKKLATKGPEGAEALAKALYQIVSAGYDGVDGLNLLEVASQAAVAGVTDTQTAADGLTSAMNAWKIEGSEAQSVADSFFTAVRLGKTTFGELANSISLVAPMASTLGVGLDEVNSAVASLTKQGTPTAVAMTQIRQIMISLNEHLGQGWRETMTFQEGMEELARMAQESGKDIKEYTGRIEGAIGIMGLTGENSEAARKDLEAFNNKLGASADAYDVMRLAAENQIKEMKNRWHDKLLAYGDNIVKMFGRIATALNSKAVIKALEDEAEAARLAVLDITALAEGTEKRTLAIEALQLLYPQYFGNLDAETVKNDEITASLARMNAEYANKIILQEYADELETIGKAEKKLEKQRLEAIKLLDTYGEVLGKTGLTYKELVNEIQTLIKEGTYEKDGYSFLLAGSSKRDLENALEFLEEYEGKLQGITDQKDDVTELKDRILELLKVSQGIDESSPDFIGPQPLDLSTLTTPKDEGFSEDAFKEFKLQLQEAKQAYNEWLLFKETTYADELQKDYDQYLNLADNYEDYLKAKLVANRGNAQAVTFILQQLAAIEAEAIALVKESILALQEEVKNDAIQAAKEIGDAWDAYLKKMDDEIQSSLEKEEAAQKLKAENAQRHIQSILDSVKTPKQRFKEEAKQLEQYYADGLITYEQFLAAMKVLEQEFAAHQVTMYADMAAGIFSELSAMAADLNDELAAGLQNFSNIASGIGQAVGSYYSGNVGGMITGIFSALTSLIGLFSRQDIDEHTYRLSNQEEAYKLLNEEIAITNRLLDDQYNALDRMQGEDWLAGVIDQFELLNDALTIARDAMWSAMNEGRSLFDPDNRLIWALMWDLQDYQDWVDANPDDPNQEAVQEWIDSIKQYQDEILELRDRVNQVLTGTTSEAITDEIVAGFENGKFAIDDFAETFEEAMKRAIVGSFQREYLEKQLTAWYKTFADLAVDGTTPEEVDELREAWDLLMEEARAVWEGLTEQFDFLDDTAADAADDASKEGLRGAIQGITEDTAGLIAGQFTAMRYNILELTEVAEDQLDALNEISLNTANTNLALAIANDTLTRINRAVGGVA